MPKMLRMRMPGKFLLLIAFCAALHAAETVTHPYAGVTYIDRTETAPRNIHMHIVRIDLNAPGLRFKMSPPAGSLEVVRETTLDYLKREHAQIAVNTNFFFPWPSAEPETSLVGIAASEGTVYSAFGSPVQNYAIVANAPGVDIDRRNRASIVHPGVTQLWNTFAGSAEIVTEGVKTIPVYDGVQLTPGNGYSDQKSWYDAINARTAIGLSRDNLTLTLFTVDARGGSEGMKVGEVADALIHDYAVWNALNMDGGGSTSLAMEDPTTHADSLINASSNTPGDVTAGRAVGASLAVFVYDSHRE